MIRALLIWAALVVPASAEMTWESRWRRIMIRPPDPGIASFFTDRLGAWGDRLGHDDCASPEEPRGTRLRICSAEACIVCTVMDKGPNARLRRPIDLSPAGFRALGFRMGDGLGRVTIDRE